MFKGSSHLQDFSPFRFRDEGFKETAARLGWHTLSGGWLGEQLCCFPAPGVSWQSTRDRSGARAQGDGHLWCCHLPVPGAPSCPALEDEKSKVLAWTGFLGYFAAWKKEKKPRQRDMVVWATQRSRWPGLQGVVSQRSQQHRDFGGFCAELSRARAPPCPCSGGISATCA